MLLLSSDTVAPPCPIVASSAWVQLVEEDTKKKNKGSVGLTYKEEPKPPGTFLMKSVPHLEHSPSPVMWGLVLSTEPFQECSVRQVWGWCVPVWSVNLVLWSWGRCEISIGGVLTIR